MDGVEGNSSILHDRDGNRGLAKVHHEHRSTTLMVSNMLMVSTVGMGECKATASCVIK